MRDDTPLSEAELARVEAAIRTDAQAILAALDQRHIDTQIALAIIGTVAGKLLERADAETRAEFIQCLLDPPNA